MAAASVLLVDDNPDNLSLLAGILRERGYQTRMAASGRWALESVRVAPPDVIMLDVSMPEMNGYEVCRRLKADPATRDIPVIFISALDAAADKVKAFQEGGTDYVSKPFQAEEVVARTETHLRTQALQKELELRNAELQKRNDELLAAQQAITEHRQAEQNLQQENVQLWEVLKSESSGTEILGHSPALRNVLQKVNQVAGTDSTVLISGETGTGKELIAQAIHERSNRKHRVLIKVNCAALPPTLIESELFGHEKGSFTGALNRKIGRFELAHRGTLFLDEIGDLPLDLQAKLLRVLQEREFERVGGTQTVKTDIRIIAATNRDLEKAVREEKYRLDLYYRLKVFPIVLPPLRERQADVEVLVRHFVARFARKMGKTIAEIPARVMDALVAYPWPGNVRELENVIERAVIITRKTYLELGDWLPQPAIETQGSARLKTLEESEREHILDALHFTGWQVSGARGAALLLGLKPTTLEARMKRLGIQRPLPPIARSASAG